MRECPKCGGRMNEGFVVDQAHGVIQVSTWQSGPPKKSFWTGIKQDRKAQIPISKSARYPSSRQNSPIRHSGGASRPFEM